MNEMTSPIPLSDATIDRRYRVVGIEAKGAIRQRMLDMGLVPGICLKIIRFAPLGDPIEIKMNRFLLSLRKEEAREVMVVDLGPVLHRGQGKRKRFGHGRMGHHHGR